MTVAMAAQCRSRLQPARLHGTLDWAPPGSTLLAITPAFPVITDAILFTTLGGGIISCGCAQRSAGRGESLLSGWA